LGMASIKRKTEQELPQYLDAIDSDTYILSDAEDLVPEFQKDNAGNYITDENGAFVLHDYNTVFHTVDYQVRTYRPRIEGVFARIERWTETGTGYIHWRVISSNNITTLYGKTASARVADPANDTRIFEWLPEFTYDDKGRCILYEYKQEDGTGMHAVLLHNRNRTNGNALFTNTYLKRAWYGNETPYTHEGEQFPASGQFLFETVLDYGEHDTINRPFNETGDWSFREDAFSTCRPGFEVRTGRLCTRVLLYHHFNELPGGSALIRSLSIHYNNNGQDGFNFLQEAIDTGYTKQDDGSYTQKSLPPVSFAYQPHNWNTNVKSMAPGGANGLPEGIDDSTYLFVDLYSEGLQGILTEQGGGWFYKNNLGDARFTDPVPVMPKPSFNGLSRQLQLLELEADGTKQVVNWQGSPQGFFELSDDAEWQPFTPFESIPNINLRDPNTRLIDLNGDGLADLLITKNEVFTWYPSKGKEGYAASKRVVSSYDEEKGPAIVFADGTQTIFLADMNGDGLQDIVRIRNGQVCYWPNMGYGRFGSKVNMDHSPVFDVDDQFSTAHIKLADIDGSGTTDILYFGANQCDIWLNQQGNAFLPFPKRIENCPAYNNLNTVHVLDLLGNGVSCIVWSSPLPQNGHLALHYIDLMDSKKPHLMIGYNNNMGKEIGLQYQPSTKYYIDDKLAGNPWVTKLHFPVHCVSKVLTYDRILKTRFATEYFYHHGYYDHVEKEFRGFGRVDQKDTEDIVHFVVQGGANAVIEQPLQQPPVLTKTWIHTGAFTGRQKIWNQFAHEYFQNAVAPENNLPEPDLPVSFTIQECREALRACKGKLLRKEVYALDGSADEDKPYVVEEHNCSIKLLQPVGQNKNGVLLTHASEGITYHYERNQADPRVSHSFVFEVDDFGNVLQSASVVYPRRSNPLPSIEQVQLHITFNESHFTNAIQQQLAYRVPASHFTKSYSVTGMAAPVDYFTWDELKTACNNATIIEYEQTPDGSLQKRLLAFVRTQYRGDNGVTVLPFGTLASRGLIHQQFKAAFTDTVLNTIFNSKISLPALTAALTDTAKGGYVMADNYFWLPSGTCNYDVAHFYLPTSFTDIFGNTSIVQYDTRFLFVEQVTDALNNNTAVDQFNYRVMSPYVMRDANDNLSAVRFDELGMVVSIFNIGKKGTDAGDEFDDTRTESQGANDFPGGEMEYHLSEWYDQTQSPGFDIDNYKPEPNYVKTRLRVTHYHADALHQTQWQEAYTYTGGGGSIVLKKAQAEPGPALQVNEDGTVTSIPDTAPNLRWIGNGRTIVNNKGNAVKQYEPYFSVAPTFDDEQDMVQLGVTPVMHYDPLSRVIRTDLPNDTFTKVEFTPWQQKHFDPNDTVRDSQWYIDNGSPDPLNPEPVNPGERAAWLAAKHYDTPVVSHLDSLGRAFLSINTDGAVHIETRNVQDIEGNLLQVIDGLGRVVVEHTYGMGGNQLKHTSMDGGSRWNINNAAGKPLLSYSDRGHTFTTDYDVLQRPVAMYVEENGVTTLFQRFGYGESLSVADAKTNNLLTKTYQLYDQAGILTSLQFDFKGNLTGNRLQLATNYRNTIDWTDISAVDLETDVFEGSSQFDGLSRMIQAIAPHNPTTPPSEIRPSYNEAGLLDKVDVFIRGAVDVTPFVTNINYNAKAQREAIFYGNGTKTSYTYDPKTFSLIRLLTTRNNGADILQDLHYTFDPAGNITEIRDDAQADIFFDGELARALNQYEYDALYRLVKAGGRKHAGQTDVNHAGPDFRHHPFIHSSVINPNDAQAFRNYTEQYQYDQANNMLMQQHTARNSSWTRTFEYNNGNNQLGSTAIGDETFNYTYDAHGNLYGLETVISEVWDFLDQFREADLGGGGTVYYVYNAGGRARKVIERLDGSRKERIYLGSVEIYREYDSADNIVLERETLHVMDDKKRIAMIDTPVVVPGGSIETQLIRYQYDNHLNSASIELDDLAQLISYEEYFPFGTTSYSTVDAGREVPAKRYRYTGKERDEESGLNYHGSRYYALWLCRWTKCDPAGIKAGPNFYVYVSNNPIMMNDPSGNDGETCGVWDEEAQACYAEACPVESTVDETPAAPPPAPLPPRVRYAPRKSPTPPPDPPPVSEPEASSDSNTSAEIALALDVTRYMVGYAVRVVDVHGNPLKGTYYLWSGDINKDAAKAAIASKGSGWLMSETPQGVAAASNFADALRIEAATKFPGQSFTNQELFDMAGDRLFLTDDQMKVIWHGPSRDIAIRAVLAGNPVQGNMVTRPGPKTVQTTVEKPAVRGTGAGVAALQGVSGALNIYGGMQEEDTTLAWLGIGGGSIEIAGGLATAAGSWKTSALLMRLGRTTGIVGTIVTAPVVLSHAADDINSGNDYREFKGTVSAVGVVVPQAAAVSVYNEVVLEPVAEEFTEIAGNPWDYYQAYGVSPF
jgi:RHS repeat-associated protein